MGEPIKLGAKENRVPILKLELENEEVINLPLTGARLMMYRAHFRKALGIHNVPVKELAKREAGDIVIDEQILVDGVDLLLRSHEATASLAETLSLRLNAISMLSLPMASWTLFSSALSSSLWKSNASEL